MKKTTLWISRFFLAGTVCLLSAGGYAADKAETETAADVFRIESAALHADGPDAELCLYFSDAIDVDDRARYLPFIELRHEGKKEKLSAKDISLTPTALCVQNLEHRAPYNFLFRKIKSVAGDRLAKDYEVDFTVPDRKPSLAFVSDSTLALLPRHSKAATNEASVGMKHLLRSVNVDRTHLTLYKIAERAALFGAWQPFTLSHLSPLESLYYVRTNGQVVFESDVVFGQEANAEQTIDAPLPADAALTPGLYFLAAAPKDQNPKDPNVKQIKPSFFAGQWFLVSDMRLMAARLPEGIKVFASNLATHKPEAAVAVQLFGRDGEVIGEVKTGADGSALMGVPDKKKDKIALLTGESTGGDVDMFDVSRERVIDSEKLGTVAFLHLDREAYQSGSTANVTLRATNGEGQSLLLKNSALKLLRSDRRLYASQPVEADKAGVHVLSVALPLAGKADTWILSWQREDGSVIAETPFTLRPGATGVKLDLRAPHDETSEGANAALALRALDAQGQPLAFMPGKVIVRGMARDVKGVDAYSFGVAPADNAPVLREIAFMTGADGRANVNVPVEKGGLWDALSLEASLEKEGVLAQTVVPVKRFSSLIGLKPLRDGPTFAENSVAQFDAIAVDANGKRRAEGDLYYLVYEEGRSFEWFASEGHWDYKPLPLHRRVGGGLLAIGASGNAMIRWPVTTGQYMLEITSAGGQVLARQSFEAGRLPSLPEADFAAARLRWKQMPQTFEEGKESKLALELDAPAFVGFVVSDGKTRHVLNRFMPEGTNDVAFAVGEDWQDRAFVAVQAQFLDSVVPGTLGQIVPVAQPRHDLGLKATPPHSLTAGSVAFVPVKIQKLHGKKPSFVTVVATPFVSSGETVFPATPAETVQLDAEGRGKVKVVVPNFDGTMRLSLAAWDESGAYGETSVTVPVQSPLTVVGSAPEQLMPGDKVQMALTLTNGSTAGSYEYELSLPPEVAAQEPTKGKIVLAKGVSQPLSFTLAARVAGEAVIGFTVRGPEGVLYTAQWPMAVLGQRELAWTSRAQNFETDKQTTLEPFATNADGQSVRFWAPFAVPDLSRAMQKVSASLPHTTEEIALWLETTRLWADEMRAFGVVSAPRLARLRAASIRALQFRQNDDGGFPAVNGDAPSDMASTAAALIALQDEAAQPSALAAAWLQTKLQNTWFDESEREVRIKGAEALARAHRADLSNLRYLAETSRDKALSPEASALLGLALVEGGDSEAAKPWIEKAQAALPSLTDKDQAVGFWRVLRALAMDERMNPEALRAFVTAHAEKLNAAGSPEEAAYGLQAFAGAAMRFGTWSVFIDGQKVKGYGLTLADEPALASGKTPALVAKQPLVLNVFTPSKDKAAPVDKGDPEASLQRTFLKRDGGHFDFDLSLMTSDAYVLLLQGDAKDKSGAAVRVVLPETSALTLLPPEDPALMRVHFAWMPESLSRVEAVSSGPSGTVLTVTPTNGTFRLALLVKPQRKGNFTLPPCRLLDAEGTLVPVSQNAVTFSVW